MKSNFVRNFLRPTLSVAFLLGLFSVSQWQVMAKINVHKATAALSSEQSKPKFKRSLRRSQWWKEFGDQKMAQQDPRKAAEQVPNGVRNGYFKPQDQKVDTRQLMPHAMGDSSQEERKIFQFMESAVASNQHEDLATLMRKLGQLKKSDLALYQEYMKQWNEHFRIFKRVSGWEESAYASNDPRVRDFIQGHLHEWLQRVDEMIFVQETEKLSL